jgi:hypothetical protein
MAVGIGAGGFMGIALESTPGTYEAPTKYFAFESESLAFTQETNFRRPIRKSASIIGAVDGNARIEGDISMEAFEDVVPYFLYCARTSIVKSGSAPNFIYTVTPTAAAVPTETMSITVVRNNIAFGYTGCVVGSFTLTVEDGTLKFNPSILGRDEADQTVPVPVFSTTTPFGAGKYNIQIPTASQVFDADGFDFSVDDSAEAQYRLKDTGRGAQFISFGERSVTLSMERDFETRTEYDAYKALTAQSITLTATKGANNQISVVMPASIKDEYTIGLSGQGDLLRASISYNGVIDGSGNDYTMVVKTQEDITV